jgi:hypothetical protein
MPLPWAAESPSGLPMPLASRCSALTTIPWWNRNILQSPSFTSFYGQQVRFQLKTPGQSILSDLIIKALAETACNKYGCIHLQHRRPTASLCEQHISEATNDGFRKPVVVRFHLERLAPRPPPLRPEQHTSPTASGARSAHHPK